MNEGEGAVPKLPSVGAVAKAVMWIGVIAGVFVVLVLVRPSREEGPRTSSSTDTEAQGDSKRVSLKVDGMACPT